MFLEQAPKTARFPVNFHYTEIKNQKTHNNKRVFITLVPDDLLIFLKAGSVLLNTYPIIVYSRWLIMTIVLFVEEGTQLYNIYTVQ